MLKRASGLKFIDITGYEKGYSLGNRVLEIVVFIMSHIKDHQGQLENIDDISSYLKSNGFTDNEISSAYSWVLDQIQAENQFLLDDIQIENSVRVISEPERRLFTTDALGYLIQLQHLGLITVSQMELLLERGSLVGPIPIEVDQLKMIISSMLFRDIDVVDIGSQQVYLLPDDNGPIN